MDALQAFLPVDIILHVLSFLDFQSFLRVSQLSSFWHSLTQNDPLWKNCATMLQVTDKPSDITWKEWMKQGFQIHNAFLSSLQYWMSHL